MESVLERKILHVDDDPAILRLVERLLSKRGYHVVSVVDPNLAVQRMKETGCRLILLDIDMPGKSGLELLREIKKIDGSIQVFMLTGMVSMSTILRATRLGAEECLFKPIQNYEEIGDAADRVYGKMLRWWRTLREWKIRKAAVEEELAMIQSTPASFEPAPILPATQTTSAADISIASFI